MSTSHTQRLRLSFAALFAVPLLAVSLAACSSSPGDEGSQTVGSSGSEATNDSKQWQLDYAACMRDQGIDLPDPKSEGGGLSMSTSQDTDTSALEEASKSCIEELGDPPAPSAEEQQVADKEFLEWATEAAECYREHGYDMPDPDPKGKTLSFPSDAPEDVIAECGGAAAQAK